MIEKLSSSRPSEPGRDADTNGLRFRCYAKVNLTLEVLGRREDGYHEISSLVQNVSLADVLTLAPAPTIGTQTDGLDLAQQENLVFRAAMILREHTGVTEGAFLHLQKRIPAAAGLGGGSSDAAASLTGLNRLWRLGLSRQSLQTLAARLGADVPYFLDGGTAHLRGRGDEIRMVLPLAPTWFVLATLAHAVADKTQRLYAALGAGDFTDGSRTLRATEIVSSGEPLTSADLLNAFSRAARTEFPALASIWERAERCTNRRWHLSGAGPTLFCLAETAAHARRIARQVASSDLRLFVARSVPNGHRRQ